MGKRRRKRKSKINEKENKKGRNLGRQAVRVEARRNAYKIIQNQAKSKFKLFQICPHGFNIN